LLLGQEIYDFSADVWSLGCIIVELFQRAPMFPFDTELAMITGIYEICGTPSRNKWDDAQKLKNYIEPIKSKPRMLQFTYEFIPKNALSLIDQMMTLDPKKRINVNNALKSKWILSMEGKKLEPMKLPDCDNFEIKMKKRIKKH
jgi:serine/threonine protein kinase